MNVLANRPAQRVGASRVARRSRVVRVAAALRPDVVTVDDYAAGPSRRGLLAMAAGALFGLASASQPAQALTCAAGTETIEEDDACRRAVLNKDAGSVLDADANYSKLTEQKFSAAPGVPVAVLDKEYVRSTLQLRESILSYASMDVADYKARVPLIKLIKTEGAEWVSKYARGGSARSDSSRRMYIAVDALIGHLSANGYAPMPKPKLRVVLTNIDQAKAFLEVNK